MNTLPLDIDKSEFDSALHRMSMALGSDYVLTSSNAIQDFRDPYAHPLLDRHIPSAVVLPGSVEDVLKVVQIANEYKVPIHTSSQGRNYGYGGAAPVLNGSIVMSLQRMNSVLEINEEAGYAVVEPGVTFFDLYDAVRKKNARYVISCPDLGWGSVIGNTLDHGLGYTPMGDHASSACGMEVVLANGDILRTGTGGMSNSNTWHAHRRGFGPSLDSIFMQSNYGIVTKMGVWLTPEPECYISGYIKLYDDAELGPMITALRPLMMDKTISGLPILGDTWSQVLAMGQQDKWFDGNGEVPDSIHEKISRELNLGRWYVRLSLSGREHVVDAQFDVIKKAFSSLKSVEFEMRRYRGGLPRESIHPLDQVPLGIPGMDLLDTIRGAHGPNFAHLDYSPILPFTADAAIEHTRLIRSKLAKFGLQGMHATIVMQRSLVGVNMIFYDRSDLDAVDACRRLCLELTDEGARYGWVDYRAHPSLSDAVAKHFDFGNRSTARTYSAIKDAFDPNGILSPGSHGIWPSRSFAQAVY